MLENVDRLLKSPTKQRGRDFAVMLASLTDLGYIVEWRVINAADYGMPQRRRRVFILGYAPGTPQHEVLKDESGIKSWFETNGPFARAFVHPCLCDGDYMRQGANDVVLMCLNGSTKVHRPN